MALRSIYERWEHKHADTLNEGYFGTFFVLKISVRNPKLEYTFGISVGQGFTRIRIEKTVKKH